MQTNLAGFVSTASDAVGSGLIKPSPTKSSELQSKAADLTRGVGCTLRTMRRERNLTQRQVGAAAGLSMSTVSEIERGNNNLSLDVLWRLCAAMSVQPYVMFEAATRDGTRRAKRSTKAN